MLQTNHVEINLSQSLLVNKMNYVYHELYYLYH